MPLEELLRRKGLVPGAGRGWQRGIHACEFKRGGVIAPMPIAILKAHYDGEHIVLDEPYQLTTAAPLMVTVIAEDGERTAWATLGTQGLAQAYGSDEPEYTVADLRAE